jgi:antitoxin component YwqK of YwqJK toxin-antitoxin module
MKIAYSAANSIEAHMVKNMLEQQEIPAYVQGEHLQSGAGELPMGGLVKVSVDNTNYYKAKEIIKNWESTEIPNAADKPSTQLVNKNQTNHANFLWLVGSFISGAILMHLYMQSPVTYNGIDLNKDKVNDISWTYKNNIAAKSEADINFDGKIDEITTYANGLLDSTKADTDFDGVFDTEYQYLNERFTLQKTDTNRDSEIDYVVEFGKNGLDFNTTIFNPKTNLIKKIQYYKMSKLVSAELDTNDDGKLDVLISYDFAEEETSRRPITNK